MVQQGTMTFSLRGHHHHRPRPQLISPLCHPQAPQATPLEVWTTRSRATIPPLRCNVSPISCPTTQGILPAQSPASQGPCTASRQKCSALVLLLPHCHWTGADTITICLTRPQKWTRALCGSFAREWTLLARDSVMKGREIWKCWGTESRTGTRIMTGLGQYHKLFFLLFFWWFHIYLFIYFPICCSFWQESIFSIKMMPQNTAALRSGVLIASFNSYPYPACIQKLDWDILLPLLIPVSGTAERPIPQSP